MRKLDKFIETPFEHTKIQTLLGVTHNFKTFFKLL